MTAATRRSLPFTVLRMNLGIPRSDLHGDLDGRLKRLLHQHLDGSRHVGAVVLYAHDRRYDPDGRRRDDVTQLYTPNEYILSLARERPDRILAAASVHPYRPDAIEELDRCIAAGAVAVKWLPNSQGIDPKDPRLDRFYDRLACAGIPLICHTGGEHTVHVVSKEYNDVKRLERALAAGATVVAAHSGTRSGLFDQDFFDDFVRMTRRWPNLYGDLAAWSAPNRVRHYGRLFRSGVDFGRILHGSDYPVPAIPWGFVGRLTTAEMRRCAAVKNPFDRDVELKRAVGLPEPVFANAARLFRRRSA